MSQNNFILLFLLIIVIQVFCKDYGITKDKLSLVESFEEFKSLHNKTYIRPLKESRSKIIFLQNLQKIRTHNKEFFEGKHLFKIRSNDLADLDAQQYLRQYVRLIRSLRRKKALLGGQEELVGLAYDGVVVPDALDWRDEGFITDAYNQKSCGSCYAYSIAGCVQGQIFKRTGKIVPLSEQQIVDCSIIMGNHGCTGGSLRNTLRYVEKDGLMRQQDYPYTASQNACRYNAALAVVNITSWAILPAKDEQALQQAIGAVGPVAVSINASPQTFQLYSDGIYSDEKCSSNTVNHAMLAVGYTQDYWILKNWWGVNWGDEGYMKIKRGVNMCGLANYAAYAIV